MKLPPRSIAEAALRVFKRRQGRPVAGHAALLRPWAAIALRCGADPAALGPDAPRALEEYRRIPSSSAAVGKTGFLTDREARACLADDQCPFRQAVAALAAARDAALDSLPPESGAASQDTQDLAVLAIHLGCPAYLPSSPRAPTRGPASLEAA